MPQFSGNLLKLTLHTNKNHQQPVEESSQPIESTSTNFHGYIFFKTPLVLIALQIEQSDTKLTTHISEVVMQDVQTQTGSDPVESIATYTLSLEGSHLCFKICIFRLISFFYLCLGFQQVLKLMQLLCQKLLVLSNLVILVYNYIVILITS
jgi:hypothetical protein